MKNVAAVTSKTYDIAVRNAAKYTTSTLEKYMNNLNQVLTIPKSLFIIIILMKRIFEEYGGLNYIVALSARHSVVVSNFLHFAVKKNGDPSFQNSLGSIRAPKTLAVCAFHFIDGWQHQNDSDLDDSDNVSRHHSHAAAATASARQ
jgi:hypothetical protein